MKVSVKNSGKMLVLLVALTAMFILLGMMGGCATLDTSDTYVALKCPAKSSEAFCKSYHATTQQMFLQAVL